MNSTGNREAKEFICTTHRHELKDGGNAGGWGGCREEGNKEEKKRDNCNSIINKIYFKKLSGYKTMLKVAYKESYRLSLTYRVGKMWSDRIQTVGILLGKTDHASLLQKSSVQNTDSLLATRLAQKCSLGTPSWQCFPSGEHLLAK